MLIRTKISISSLTRKNYEFHFKNNICNIYLGKEMVGMGYLIRGLYYIDNIFNDNVPQFNVRNDNANIMLIEITSNSKQLWHLRLCHIAEDRITKFEKDGNIE